MLTVDPSQKKVVWILMAVLIGAICVTAVRMKPAGNAGVAAVTEPAAQAASTQGRAEVQVQNLSRNPFKAPDAYSNAQAQSNAAEMGGAMPNSGPGSASGLAKGQTGTLPPVQPMVVKMPKAGQSGAKLTASSQPRPVFALLATIQSGGSVSAVIKSSDSTVRVVNVGDTLDGGYKVRALAPGRAVLSNGEDTIIASKPQS